MKASPRPAIRIVRRALDHALAFFGKYLPQSSFRRDVAQSLTTNILIMGLATVSGVLLARLLGPEGRGQLAAIQALPAMLTGLASLGLFEAVIYFGGKEPAKASVYSVSAAALISIVGLPVTIVGAFFVPALLSHYPPAIVTAGQVYLAMVFADALSGVTVFRARATHEISLWNGLRLLSPAAWLVLVAIFYLLSWQKPDTLALAYLCILFVLGLLLIVRLRARLQLRWKVQPGCWPRLFRYGFPVALGSTPQLMNQRIDQVLIAAMLRPEELGYYAVAVSWAALLRIPTRATTAVAFSKIVSLGTRRKQLAFSRRAAVVLALINSAGAVLLGFLSPLVIPLLFGPPFRSSVPLAVLLLVAELMRGVVMMVQTVLKGIGKPSIVFYSEWLAFAVILGTAPFLIDLLGVMGAAVAIVISSLASLLTALLLASRYARTDEQDS